MAVKIQTRDDIHLELLSKILNARNALINSGFKGPFKVVLPAHFAKELGELFITGIFVSDRILECEGIEEITLRKNFINIQVECSYAGP